MTTPPCATHMSWRILRNIDSIDPIYNICCLFCPFIVSLALYSLMLGKSTSQKLLPLKAPTIPDSIAKAQAGRVSISEMWGATDAPPGTLAGGTWCEIYTYIYGNGMSSNLSYMQGTFLGGTATWSSVTCAFCFSMS